LATQETMLVIDDEALPRTLLTVSLREAGYRVVEADGGKAALVILREQPVDVVLLDLVMPDMDGFQVLRRMKADDLLKDIPIVVVSASDDMNSVVRCIEMGAVDHLSKPFDPVLLRVRIRSALAMHQMGGERSAGGQPVRAGTRPRRFWAIEGAEEGALEPRMKISGFLKTLFKWSRPYRKQTILFAALILVCLGIEAALPMGFKFITDDALIPHNFRLLVLILGVLIIAMLVAASMQILTDYLYARLAVKILNDLRFSMYRHLQRLSMGYFSRVSSGEIMSRFTTDLAAVENTVMLCVPAALGNSMTALFTLGLLFTLEWKLALFAIFGIFVSYRAEQRIEKPAAEADFRMKKDMAGIAAALQEVVTVQQTIKSFRLQNLVAERFKHRLVGFLPLAMRAWFLSYLTEQVPSRCAAIFGVLTIAGGGFLTFFGFLTIGELVSFQVLLSGLIAAVSGMTWSMPYLVRATGGMQKVEDLLDEKPDVSDAPDAVPLPPPAREISFDHVSFGYAKGETQLSDVTMTIPVDVSALIVGPSGSGKSTVINLLMRLYDPQEGTVSIDGYDLCGVTQESLGQHMGVVFQDSFLFDTTIRENIRAGKQGATNEEVEGAARAVGMHEIIMGLPGGYDMTVGERGGKLSVGHRQRLAIARALLSEPEILILDDATSALDSATTALIHRSIREAGKRRTLISVANRLESQPSADIIFVFEEGRLVESGSHAELVYRGGAYSRLWEKRAGQRSDMTKANGLSAGADSLENEG
jgi:ATP-binding cassette, subfamily B, bacterial